MAKAATPSPTQPRRLYRSEHNKVIGGVAGGMGEYFGIDPVIIRIIFIFLTIAKASGILIYLILWFLIPSESRASTTHDDTIRENLSEMRLRANDIAGKIRSNFNGSSTNSHNWWAVLIIVAGVLFLMSNFGYLDYIDFEKLWPVALILLGLSLFIKQ